MRLCSYQGVIGLICFFISSFAFSIGASCPTGSVGALLDLKGSRNILKSYGSSSKSQQGCALSSQNSRKLYCQNKIKPFEDKGSFFVVTGQEKDKYFIHNVQVLDNCKLFDQICGSIFQSKVYTISEELKPFMSMLEQTLKLANESNNCEAFNRILGVIADPTIITLDNGEKGLYFETGDTSCSEEVPNCVNKDHFCVVKASGSSCGWSGLLESGDGIISISENSGSLFDYARGGIMKTEGSTGSGSSSSSSSGSSSNSSGSSSSSSSSGSSSSGLSSNSSGSSSNSSGSSSNSSGSSSNSSGSSSNSSGSSSGDSSSNGSGLGNGEGNGKGNGKGDGEGQIDYPNLDEVADGLGNNIPGLLKKARDDVLTRLHVSAPVSGSCTPISFTVFGQTQSFDLHCQIIERAGDTISSASLFAWSLLALAVILSA